MKFWGEPQAHIFHDIEDSENCETWSGDGHIPCSIMVLAFLYTSDFTGINSVDLQNILLVTIYPNAKHK